MTTPEERALLLLRHSLGDYVDVEPHQLVPDTELAAIGVDSLTLAELYFGLEDRLGRDMGEPPAVPTHLRDLIALVVPYLPADDEAASCAAGPDGR